MVRKANKGDCIRLVSLAVLVWLHTYASKAVRNEISQYVMSMFTVRKFAEIIDSEVYDILVYIRNDHLLGYIIVNLGAYFESESNGFEIDTIFVQESSQGKGIGQRLLLEIMALHGNSFWVSTRTNNQNAIRFYKRFGFRFIRQMQREVGGQIDNRSVLTYSGVD